MRSIISLAFAVAALALTGCVANNTVLVSTATIIGVDIGQDPSTGMYHAKLGYNRGELAMVPSTNRYTPDVITELKYNGIFSTGADSGIYQRMAVGATAVSQPGAMAMFLKGSDGKLTSNSVEAIKSLSSVPVLNVSALPALSKLAVAYRASTDKPKWDAVAQAQGYSAFSFFLIDTSLTPDKVTAMSDALRAATLIQ